MFPCVESLPVHCTSRHLIPHSSIPLSVGFHCSQLHCVVQRLCVTFVGRIQVTCAQIRGIHPKLFFEVGDLDSISKSLSAVSPYQRFHSFLKHLKYSARWWKRSVKQAHKRAKGLPKRARPTKSRSLTCRVQTSPNQSSVSPTTHTHPLCTAITRSSLQPH